MWYQQAMSFMHVAPWTAIPLVPETKRPNQAFISQYACTIMANLGLSNTLVVFRLQVLYEKGGVVVEEKE